MMQALEHDANEALDGVRDELDALSGSVEVISHSKVGNDRINLVSAWIETSMHILSCVCMHGRACLKLFMRLYV
jgi:hypothetical protein